MAVFPAGSNGEFNLPEDLATVIHSGTGCRLVTASGQKMLDFSMGWGSVLVGHADPRITDYWSSQHMNRSLARRITLELFRRGIFLNPMGTKLYLSLAHDQAVCDQFLSILDDVLAEVKVQTSASC